MAVTVSSLLLGSDDRSIDAGGLVVLAGTRGCSERKRGPGSGGVAGAFVGPLSKYQDHGLIEGTAPGVAFAVWVSELSTVLLAFAAQVAECGGVAAGFGEEVPAVAEGVRPFA